MYAAKEKIQTIRNTPLGYNLHQDAAVNKSMFRDGDTEEPGECLQASSGHRIDHWLHIVVETWRILC